MPPTQWVTSARTTTCMARSGTPTSAAKRRSGGYQAGLLGDRILGGVSFHLQPLHHTATAPHLRRRDRVARIARRQEGTAAVQASVPRELRPLQQADDDQQHRDVCAVLDHPQRRRGFPQSGPPEQRRHQIFSVSGMLRARAARINLGTPFAKLLEMAGGMRDSRELKACIPGGSSMPVLPGRDHDGHRHGLRLHRQSRVDAGLERRHHHGRHAVQVRSYSCGCRISTSRNRAGSARLREHRLAVARCRSHRARPGPQRRPRSADLGVGQHRRAHDLRAGRRGGLPVRALSSISATSSSTTSTTSAASFRTTSDHGDAQPRNRRQRRSVAAGKTVMDAAHRARPLRPALLLAQEADDRRQLPHVPGAGREGAEAAAGLRHAGDRGCEGVDARRAPSRRKGCDGVPADQPSARLPRICDQGGDAGCRTSPLAGAVSSRYNEPKRVVLNKNLGPLISTDMTRCIHCTRCVRFGQEIAGVMELGMAGRGEHAEIMSFVGRTVDSELSGNMIDLCPVGALTSKPFRYSARTWELARRKSISPHDGLGSNLIVQVKNERVMRVVPLENEAVNECWLSDKDRFSYEGLNSEDRLTRPQMVVGGALADTDWQTALERVATELKRIVAEHGPRSIASSPRPIRRWRSCISPRNRARLAATTSTFACGDGFHRERDALARHASHRIRRPRSSARGRQFPAQGSSVARAAIASPRRRARSCRSFIRRTTNC